MRQREGDPQVQQLLSLEVSQRYYTDQRAASYDQQSAPSLGPDGSVLPPPTNFSPINLSLSLTPTPTISGQFGMD